MLSRNGVLAVFLVAALVLTNITYTYLMSNRTQEPPEDFTTFLQYIQSMDEIMEFVSRHKDYSKRFDDEIAKLQKSGELLQKTVSDVKDNLETCKNNLKSIQRQQETYYKTIFQDLARIHEYERLHNNPVECNNSGELINFILCVRGREVFLDRLLHSIEKMVRRDNNCNINLIITSYVIPNPVKDIKNQIFVWSQRTGIRASVIEMDERFSKAKGLLTAIKTLPNDALACTIDVDMLVPEDYATRIRANTVKGKSVYCPIVYSLNILQPPSIRGDKKIARFQFDGESTGNLIAGGWWRAEGYGNIAYYISDAMKVGAYSSDASKGDWGLEDKRFALSFDNVNIKLTREKVEGLYHLWHPKSNWEDSADGL